MPNQIRRDPNSQALAAVTSAAAAAICNQRRQNRDAGRSAAAPSPMPRPTSSRNCDTIALRQATNPGCSVSSTRTQPK
jgi:hypothetical protein